MVGIDEANFFGPALSARRPTELADAGKHVIVAGLDTDYLGRPFPPMPDLLALAESITKMPAICMRCGAPAKHTQRLVESEELIFVGAVDSYEARCQTLLRAWFPAAGGTWTSPYRTSSNDFCFGLKHNRSKMSSCTPAADLYHPAALQPKLEDAV